MRKSVHLTSVCGGELRRTLLVVFSSNRGLYVRRCFRLLFVFTLVVLCVHAHLPNAVALSQVEGSTIQSCDSSRGILPLVVLFARLQHHR